jgi:phytanoyl-CoA hydroxylase
VGALVDLLGPNVELHHTTLHLKPPETGHPFPLHQDDTYYPHTDDRYIDVLVHLDDTRHENGETMPNWAEARILLERWEGEHRAV